MLEVRIACYTTCDYCGDLGRAEVPAAVAAPWLMPVLKVPEGWRSEVPVRGGVEKHRCASCIAKIPEAAHEPNPKQEEFARQLAEGTKPEERA